MKKTKTFLAIIGGSTLFKSIYNRYEDREYHARLQELLDQKVQLSGIKIRSRPPKFSFLGILNDFLPYHQSLEIPQQDGTTRHVGLAMYREVNDTPSFTRQTEFVLHKGPRYDFYNILHSDSIPIEAWTGFKHRFGHYPKIKDPETLNHVLPTRDEVIATGKSIDAIERQTWMGSPFLSVVRYHNGDPTLYTCRSAIMGAVERAEIIENSYQCNRHELDSFKYLVYGSKCGPDSASLFDLVKYKLNIP